MDDTSRRLTPGAAPPDPPGQRSPGVGPGELIDGRYQLEALLGSGGMGAVWAAREVRSQQRVALKLLAESGSAEDLLRFEREALLAARVDRDGGVVRVHAAGLDRGRAWVAMELVEGRDLGRVIAEEGPLEPRRLARIVLRVARTLAACHAAGVLHRDLKPANVLLSAQDQPRLCDFGLARDASSGERLTRTGEVLGTPSFMSPEQASDASRALDQRVDVWGLGAILYAGLTGQPPFLGQGALDTLRRVLLEDPVPPRRLRAGTPPGLEAICLTALAKEPARRYPGAAALADDLARWLEAQPVQARLPGPLRRFVARWRRGQPGAVLAVRGLLGAGAVLLLGLTLLATWAAPLALRRHLRWEEQVLRGSSLGLLPDDPPLPVEALEARRRHLARLRWLLLGRDRVSCDLALRRLDLALGSPPLPPSGQAPPEDAAPPLLLHEGLALLAAGQPGPAQERLQRALERGEDGLALRAGLLRATLETLPADDAAAAGDLLSRLEGRYAQLERDHPAWEVRERRGLQEAARRALETVAADLDARASELSPAAWASARAGLCERLERWEVRGAARERLWVAARERAAPAWVAALERLRGAGEAGPRLEILSQLAPGPLPPTLRAAVEALVARFEPASAIEQARLASEARLWLGVPVSRSVQARARRAFVVDRRQDLVPVWVVLPIVFAAEDRNDLNGESLMRHVARGDPELAALRAAHPDSQALAFLELLDHTLMDEGKRELLPRAEGVVGRDPGRGDLARPYLVEAWERLVHLLARLTPDEGVPARSAWLERTCAAAAQGRRVGARGRLLFDLATAEADAAAALGQSARSVLALSEAVDALRWELGALAREEIRDWDGTGPRGLRGILARALHRLAYRANKLQQRQTAITLYREALELYQGPTLAIATDHPAETLGNLLELLVDERRLEEVERLLPPPGHAAWADEDVAEAAVDLWLLRGQPEAAREALHLARQALEGRQPGWLAALQRRVHEAAQR